MRHTTPARFSTYAYVNPAVAAVLEAGTDLAVVGRAGIGLDNVNQRLTKLFGAQSALHVTSTSGAGTSVAFYVPSRIPIAAR